MAYVDFPEGLKGQKQRKAFWLSDEGLQLITGWRRNGVSLTEIATKNIGVSKTAFWGWYRESDKLRKACANAKDVADSTVEDALYRKAVGYYYEEETYELVEGEMLLIRKNKRYMPPDTKAILQWLYNRLPNQWRAVQEPLDKTQYVETIQQILVAMKEVAENKEPQEIEVKEDTQE